jgi:serine phosphatase RsbU (regulator of sigma subunit)
MAGAQGLILVWGGQAGFGPNHPGLLTQLATSASVALDMAWQLEREHEAAVTLQESLLPVHLPEIDGLAVACRYLPATRSDVGGDWYDVFSLENGDVVLVVGDVTGHDLRAAALMGQLRLAIQAYALDGHTPTEVLDRVDRLLQRLDGERLATLVYAVLEKEGPNRLRLRIANAGHPPPLLVDPNGLARFVTGGLSVPLGVDDRSVRHREASVRLEPGSQLLLYSDGLIEGRSLLIEDAFDCLLAVASKTAGTPDQLCDRVLSTTPGSRSDDICLLAVSFGADPGAT